MEKRYLTKQPHAMPFSHGIIITKPEKFIFLAGQCAWDRQGPDRKLVGPGNIEVQTRQVYENIKTLLAKAGASFEDVVEMTVFLVDMNLHPICGRIGKEYIPDPPPTQHLIGVKSLVVPELMIEISVLAVQ